MTRMEAKIEMRKDMEDKCSQSELTEVLPLYGMTPNAIMSEVEKGSELGEMFLSDFILYNANEDDVYVDEDTRTHVVALMQKDLETKEPEWADNKFILDHNAGELISANQVVQQIKDGTDFGLWYAEEWLYLQISVVVSRLQSN
jgi:hypothetical protein